VTFSPQLGFDENRVVRDTDGKFGNKVGGAPEVVLAPPTDDRTRAKALRRLALTVEREHPGLMVGFQMGHRPGPPSFSISCIAFEASGGRGKGAGTAAMGRILAHADDTGQRVSLTPSDAYGGDVERLHQFYARLGFERNIDSGLDDELVRYPGVAKQP